MFKFDIIQAEHGDCLILTFGSAEHPRYILIDGGPESVYPDHLREALVPINAAGKGLDLVILSHVDNDHVHGLLDLMEELEAQREAGEEATIRIASLWHNTFSQTTGSEIEGRFRSLMEDAPTARSLMIFSDHTDRSIRQGDQLTQLADRLGIGINPEFPHRDLICVDDVDDPIEFDNLSLRIVGPTKENLEELKEEWLEWLVENERGILARDPILMERSALAADRSIPNLSSIMLLAEAGGKRILLTGDGRGDHLLQGLERAGVLEPGGVLHVDVFKVPHHGSSRNVTRDFFKTITADRYVISANGRHDNPDLHTLRWLVETAHEDGREIEIILTNSTDSTRQIVAEYDPDEYGYRLIEMDPGQHALSLDLTI